MPDNKILVSRPYYQGLGHGLETWWPRSWSWSRDLVAKVLVLVSRPGGQGLGLGLETWWPRSWSWSRAFFKGLDNKSAFQKPQVFLYLLSSLSMFLLHRPTAPHSISVSLSYVSSMFCLLFLSKVLSSLRMLLFLLLFFF